MNGPALVAARQRLGLTEEQLAAELGVPPHAYHACEQGRATLPRRVAGQLAFRIAVAERQDALQASGLPECAWMARWDAETPTDSGALPAHVQRAEAHAAGCAACQDRERFVRERFPTMPEFPMPGWMRALRWVNARVDLLPAWLRPAAWGALLLAALVSVRVLLVLPAAASRPALLRSALGAVLAATAAGAVGGLAYGVLGRPLRRVPIAGPYLAGIVAVLGYGVGLVVLMTVLDAGGARSGPTLDPFTVGFFSVLAVLFGSILGHQLFREPTAEPAAEPTAEPLDAERAD